MDIKIKSDSSRLVGYSDGRLLYDTQIDGKLSYEDRNSIIFPVSVRDISLSYIDGFMSGVYKHIEKNEVSKYIRVEGHSKVIDKFELYLRAF